MPARSLGVRAEGSAVEVLLAGFCCLVQAPGSGCCRNNDEPASGWLPVN